jgi:hypothetical protein
MSGAMGDAELRCNGKVDAGGSVNDELLGDSDTETATREKTITYDPEHHEDGFRRTARSMAVVEEL